jgi:hypothetical protein
MIIVQYKTFQVATVSGSYGECGKDIFPGLFVMIDDPKVIRFIQNVSSMAEKVLGNQFVTITA